MMLQQWIIVSISECRWLLGLNEPPLNSILGVVGYNNCVGSVSGKAVKQHIHCRGSIIHLMHWMMMGPTYCQHNTIIATHCKESLLLVFLLVVTKCTHTLATWGSWGWRRTCRICQPLMRFRRGYYWLQILLQFTIIIIIIVLEVEEYKL